MSLEDLDFGNITDQLTNGNITIGNVIESVQNNVGEIIYQEKLDNGNYSNIFGVEMLAIMSILILGLFFSTKYLRNKIREKKERKAEILVHEMEEIYNLTKFDEGESLNQLFDFRIKGIVNIIEFSDNLDLKEINSINEIIILMYVTNSHKKSKLLKLTLNGIGAIAKNTLKK